MGEQLMTKVTMLFLWPSFLDYAKIMEILIESRLYEIGLTWTIWVFLALCVNFCFYTKVGSLTALCCLDLMPRQHFFRGTEQLCRNSSKPNFALCLWLTPLTFVALIWMSFGPTKLFCKLFSFSLKQIIRSCSLPFILKFIRGFKLSIK